MTDRGAEARRDGARTVFLGSGAFGSDSLTVLADHPEIDLVGVVTAPPRPGHRGRLTPTSIHVQADALGIVPVLTPERLREAAAVATILDLEPDLLVLADYGQIVPPALLEVRHGALNLHPSALPRHRGATPIQTALLSGDDATAVTLIRMDAGLDTGPVVARERVDLDGSEITPTLEAKLGSLAADLLRRSVGPWLRGELAATPQHEVGVTLTRPLRRADGRLDPQLGAVELERQIRAMQPWPGSFIDTPLGRIVVWAAAADARATVAADAPAPSAPGTFDALGLLVARGERLRLLEVQPAGGKRMPWSAFINGRPAIVGATVLSGPDADVR